MTHSTNPEHTSPRPEIGEGREGKSREEAHSVENGRPATSGGVQKKSLHLAIQISNSKDSSARYRIADPSNLPRPIKNPLGRKSPRPTRVLQGRMRGFPSPSQHIMALRLELDLC
ncbi:hypothetical protein chiPu_0001742 [Chiloscyllium punctatum]|uniref:Uncharacterized protein n=1 Tax=Chiloscyllium punctatum TaxID=137246 RepID=A0A401RZ24_CHIPU|nr:hypothetical protein [Chiloscyllium punctatum]